MGIPSQSWRDWRFFQSDLRNLPIAIFWFFFGIFFGSRKADGIDDIAFAFGFIGLKSGLHRKSNNLTCANVQRSSSRLVHWRAAPTSVHAKLNSLTDKHTLYGKFISGMDGNVNETGSIPC